MWTCKFCQKEFDFEKPQSRGAHITNCDMNPNRQNTLDTLRSITVKPRVEIIKNCKKCRKEFYQYKTDAEILSNRDIKVFCEDCLKNRNNTIENRDFLKVEARKLRIIGISIKKIAKILNCGTGTVSTWVEDISLTPEQITQNTRRLNSLSYSNARRAIRAGFQNIGKERVTTEDPLYLAGCMLYWGEGSKSKNTVVFTNSNLAMMIVFKNFLQAYFEVKGDQYLLKINCYTDLHSFEEIKNYWLSSLCLKESNLRKCQINNAPKSSKQKRNKLEWGTATLTVSRTEIVQEIFGAIQEYGKFTESKWLG